MAYQSENNDGKFLIFSCQASKYSSGIPPLSDGIDGSDETSSSASSPADLPLPAFRNTRFINRSIDNPLPTRPAVFTLPDLSKSPESLDSMESVGNVDMINSIETIDNNEHGQTFTVATAPVVTTTTMACDTIPGQTDANLPNEYNSSPCLWGGRSDSSGLAFQNTYNPSAGLGYGLDSNISDFSAPSFGINTNLEPSIGYGYNTSYDGIYGGDRTAAFDNSYFAASNTSLALDNSCPPLSSAKTSLTPPESVLGKRLQDDSDAMSDSSTVSPLKRNRLQDDIEYYLVHTLHQDPVALAAQLAGRHRPTIFDDIYRSQRLKAAMADACGDTTTYPADATATATTLVSPNPGQDQVNTVTTYFGSQPASAGPVLNLVQPQVLSPMLNMDTMSGLGGMSGLAGLGLGLDNLGLGLNMGATQDGALDLPTTTVPQAPPVYMDWPTGNMD